MACIIRIILLWINALHSCTATQPQPDALTASGLACVTAKIVTAGSSGSTFEQFLLVITAAIGSFGTPSHQQLAVAQGHC